MYKKIISFFIITTLVFSNCITVFAAIDVKPPELDVSSLKVDKKEIRPGERVKITLRATDDMTGISHIDTIYYKPITGMSHIVQMQYNSQTGEYEGYIDVNDTTEDGIWKIDRILLSDISKNRISIYNINTNINMDWGIREDLSVADFKVSGTSADVKPPELDLSSLKVDKKEVKPGERAKITLKAVDDIAGIKYVHVMYDMPITNKTEWVEMEYNSQIGLYEGYINVNETTEGGVWRINYISLHDMEENQISIYNINTNIDMNWGIREDLSIADFKVIGTSADIKPPTLDVSSLKVDKKEIKPGEREMITLKATDDMVGIEYVYIMYYKPITGKTERIKMKYNSKVGLYEGFIDINETTEKGIWKIYYIDLRDNVKNEIRVYNSNTDIDAYRGIMEDLNAGDFTVIDEENSQKPIEGIRVVTKSENWASQIINGDLYIGPEAALNIKGNVIVNGNVYVLGELKSYGGLNIKGTLYGTNISFGKNTTLDNGNIVISGTNSIGSTSISNYPVQDIPLRIDNESLIAEGGKLNIKGATIDIANMYIEGQKVILDYQGRFNLKDLYIGSKEKITVEFKTVFGNTITKELHLGNHEKEDINNDGVVDVLDLAQIAVKYNRKENEEGYNNKYDLNKDGIIDIYDIVLISKKCA